METRIYTRLNKSEKETLKNLATKFEMTVSDYIKCKLFDHNPDLLEDAIKYVCPHTSKQAYFLAYSQIRIQSLLKKLLLMQASIDTDAFNKFRKEDEKQVAEILSELGYKKIKNNYQNN